MSRLSDYPLLLLGLLLPALTARADSLEAALGDAYQNNAVIQATRYQVQATAEAVPQARAGWRPNVALTAGLSRLHQYFGLGLPGLGPVQNLTQRSVILTVAQPLYRAGGVDAQIAAAERDADAAGHSLSGTEQDQLLEAAARYLDCWRDQSVVDLNAKLVEVLGLNRHDVETTFKAGAATETDTAQAAARLAGATAGTLASRAQLETDRARFRAVVGRDPGLLDPPHVIGLVPTSEADAASLAREHEPQILAARQRRAAAEQQVEVARAALLPRLDAVAELEHLDDGFLKGVKQNAASIGLQASVPILSNGGVDYAKIRAARDSLAAADRLVLDAERQSDARVAGAWNRLKAAEAQASQYRAAIDADDVALSDTRKEVTVGTRTRLDVLNAEQELFSGRVSLVSAQHDVMLASFELEAAVGDFTPKSLGLGVAGYDPDAYRAATRDRWFGTTPP